MNSIEDRLIFSEEKPAVAVLRQSTNLKIIAIGLLKGQLLKKHTTHVPTYLTVLDGEIEFRLPNEINVLKHFDVFDIPVDTLHEVVGLSDKNVFILVKDLNEPQH